MPIHVIMSCLYVPTVGRSLINAGNSYISQAAGALRNNVMANIALALSAKYSSGRARACWDIGFAPDTSLSSSGRQEAGGYIELAAILVSSEN